MIPTFSSHRRRGQALILAVLVMLLAAVLGSTFIVLIGSTNQEVNKDVDKSRAQVNVEVGVKEVLNKINKSDDPDLWSPENDLDYLRTPADFPPDASQPDYNAYWTPLDKTMGWALDPAFRYSSYTNVAHMRADLNNWKYSKKVPVYIKVPSPLSNLKLPPKFMVSSRLLWDSRDEITDGGDKKWMMATTVIGLTERDANSWARRTIYKPTNMNGGTMSFANFVHGYDFSNNTFAQVEVDVNGGNTVTLRKMVNGVSVSNFIDSSNFFTPGQTVMFVSKNPNVPSFSTVVAADSLLSFPQIRLRDSLPTAFTQGDSVRVVGSLMNGNPVIDANGDGIYPTGTTDQASVTTPVVNFGDTLLGHLGNGVHFNLGMVVPDSQAVRLSAPWLNPASGAYSGQNSVVSTGPVQFQPLPRSLAIANGATASPVPVPPPPAQINRFFRAFFNPAGTLRVQTVANDLNGVEAPKEIVPSKVDFTPLIGRYAKLAIGSDTEKGKLGYGPGVYINNADEMDGGATPFTNSQLHRWWQRKSFPATGSLANIVYTGNNAAISGAGILNAARLCYPRPGVDSYEYPRPSGTTLEEKGIRGWVSPWEFLPRGTVITLDGTDIAIDRDALSDDSPSTPKITKQWRSPVGTITAPYPYNYLDPNASNIPRNGGNYRMYFNTNETIRYVGFAGTGNSRVTYNNNPAFNGVIFAEGNIRIRGKYTGSRPLTIVSGGNIYIEGRLRSESTTNTPTDGTIEKNIVLIARKNVVLNPTQFFARPVGVVDSSVAEASMPGYLVAPSVVSQPTELRATPTVADRLKVGDFFTLRFNNMASQRVYRVASKTYGTPLSPGNPISVTINTNPSIGSGGESTNLIGYGNCTIIPISDPKVVRVKNDGTITTNAADGATYAYHFDKAGQSFLRFFDDGDTDKTNYTLKHSAEKIEVGFKSNSGLTNPNAEAGIANYTLTSRPNSAPVNTSSSNERLIQGEVAGGVLPTVSSAPKNFQFFLNAVDAANPSTPTTNEGGDVKSTLGVLESKLETNGSYLAPPGIQYPWWKVDLPTTSPNFNLVAARRLGHFPLGTAQNGASAEFKVPLTVSMLRFWNTQISQTSGHRYTTTDATGWLLTPNNTGALFTGTTPGLASPRNSSGFPDDKDETFDDLQANFYGQAPTWSPFYLRNSSSISNKYFLMMRDLGGDIYSIPGSPVNYTDSLLPDYYLSSYHLEGEQTGVTLRRAYNCVVDAHIYAQTGSFFVIAPPHYAQPGETGDVRRLRHNFQYTLTGNLAQCYTPSATLDYDNEPDPDGLAQGPMARWFNAVARPTQLVNPGQPSESASDWQNPERTAKPLQIQDISGGERLYLPSSPNILYISSS